jgi:HEPN domain-containing protein
MDLEKLELLAKVVLESLNLRKCSANEIVARHDHLEAEFKNLMTVAINTLPEHKELFTVTYEKTNLDYGITVDEARSVISHLLDVILIQKTTETKIREMKIFESAEEKMRQAGLSFRKEDYSSTFHNLNTALELVLKDKVEIPTTITGINTSNIIDVLTKYKVESFLFLEEARKHILLIDNKIKHQGYSPSKADCINGIKAMENLIAKLRNTEMKLTEEVKNKIYDGL